MGNVNMEASQINYRGGSKKMSVEEAIKAAGTEITPEEKEWIDTIPELASQEIIAPEFDADAGVYAVGDLVIYQGGLYQFTTAHETAGAWNAEEVAAVKVSDELDSLKSGLTNLSDNTARIYENTPLIFAGQSVTVDLSTFTQGRPYIILCGGRYNDYWGYCGMLIITENNGAKLSDLITKEGLSVSVNSYTLTVTNNNIDNDQHINIKIIG